MKRQQFRSECVKRDGGTCVVPWCRNDASEDPDGPGEVHHIIERELWEDGGYIPSNGSCVCNPHHKMAEKNEIPPQAFWRWIGVDDPPLPEGVPMHTNKWGDPFDTPAHDDLREYIKYPSSRHLLPCYWQSDRGAADDRTGRDDTGMVEVQSLLEIPLVATVKLDGSNALLVKDPEEPVRARNGREATHESFNRLKQEYWTRNVYEELPDHLQVFGENVYAKHSIHYGCPCDGCQGCVDRGPGLEDVFYVFGVYDTRYHLWLSWPETEQVADSIGFPVADVWSQPDLDHVADYQSFTPDNRSFMNRFSSMGDHVIDRGHEGIVVRTFYPFHYGQFSKKLGKYVRPHHVTTDDHWKHQPMTRNKIEEIAR